MSESANERRLDPLVRFAGMPWVECITRKDTTDCRTGEHIPKGSRAMRPLTNGKRRYLRMKPNPSRQDQAAERNT